jgi:hypothetical protein
MEWMDIETAPKDGAHFIGAVKLGQYRKLRRSDWHIAEAHYGSRYGENRFVFSNLGTLKIPTHWQPLPEPPKE